MPEASRLIVAACWLSASTLGSAACVAPGVALASAGVLALALASNFGRDSSIDFSGVTNTSPFDSRPSLASAPASASAQLSPLRLHEQVGSRLWRYFSALGMSMYFAPLIDTACSIWPDGG